MSVIERIENGEIKIKIDLGKGYYEVQSVTHQEKWRAEAKEELIKFAKLGKRMQWVSVAEMLPEIGDVVNIVTANRDGETISTSAVRVVAYEGCATYYWQGGTYWQMILPERVTHWMPLPACTKGVE